MDLSGSHACQNTSLLLKTLQLYGHEKASVSLRKSIGDLEAYEEVNKICPTSPGLSGPWTLEIKEEEALLLLYQGPPNYGL